MQDASKTSSSSTECKAVEPGLETLIKLRQQEGIKALRGKLKWEGSLDEMRLSCQMV
jgi:hypothetical protein